jgi:hypothetical protein
MRPHEQAFPHLDLSDLAIPWEWVDASWGNDAAPKFRVPGTGLRVWVDGRDPDTRELPWPRFSVELLSREDEEEPVARSGTRCSRRWGRHDERRRPPSRGERRGPVHRTTAPSTAARTSARRPGSPGATSPGNRFSRSPRGW